MRKLLVIGILLFSFPLLAACGSESDEPQEENATETTEEPEKAEEKDDVGENLLTSKKLEERIQAGMSIDSYAAELTAMEEKGKTALLKKYNVRDNKEIKAHILQSSDGFVAVETDGVEVTDVNNFKSIEEAEAHLKEIKMEEQQGE
jgi:hypothetical protein